MDFIPKVKLNYDPDEDIDTETGENNPNFIYDSDDDSVVDNVVDVAETKQDEFIPKPTRKEIIEEDIFDDIPKKEPKAQPVKEKKKRKPMTEEHKAKLFLARDKAQLVRKKNAEERKKIKGMEQEEKELIKLKRVKDLQKLKDEVEGTPAPKSEPIIREVIKEVYKEPQLTKKDLEQAQLEAIMKYDFIRKERKAEKAKKKETDERDALMRKKLMRALNPNNKFGGSSHSGF